jgi:Type IV secretion-system coupling protein DNA-binding domain
MRAHRIALAASGLLEVFKKMWPEAWGVRMEHILRNILMALLEQPSSTMHDIVRVITDQKFRAQLAKSVRNESVKRFFEKEYGSFSFGYRSDGTAPIQNKVGAFLIDPMLNRIVTASKQELHIRQIMDEGKVLLVNLAKGRIGEDSSSLLGGLLVTTIGLAAFSRAEIPPDKRRDFFVYVDEFQSLTTLAVANMLSELRKYRIAFSMAHQYLNQLDLDIRHAVLGNVGPMISFRVGAEDAPYIAREFAGSLEEIDLLQLPNHRIYLKLMIDGEPSKPFCTILRLTSSAPGQSATPTIATAMEASTGLARTSPALPFCQPNWPRNNCNCSTRLCPMFLGSAHSLTRPQF